MSDHSTTNDLPNFTIIGSGLAGPLMACYLARTGKRVDLYDKRSDPRLQESGGGRSINLALSVRGIHALREVGLAEEVIKTGIIMRGRMMHSPSGELTFQPYGTDETQALYSVSRSGLNQTLVEAAARYPQVRLFFEHKCQGVDVDTGEVRFLDGHNQPKEVSTHLLIGADGAYSRVRGEMQKRERFNYQQEYLEHGYKELTIPPGADGSYRMEPHALHIWPRGQYMMIALPNRDGSFTCTLFWPYEGPHSFARLRSEEEVLRYFQQQFPDAVPLMPTLVQDFLHNPVGALVTTRCQPWHVEDRVVLIGDACHAVVPFLGQGMNASFEDCTVLHECLVEHEDPGQALRTYEERRRKHLNVLADLCVENFIEMRDRVGSRFFVLGKKMGLLLHKLFPRWYIPLYTMVEFTRIPYADALRRARLQDRVVRGCVLLLLLGILLLVGWLWMRG